MNFSKDIEVAWKLKSLHNVAVALKQLHGVGICHQDLKPSNVLLYEEGKISKIGDLGRSLCLDIEAPHDNGGFSGANSYTPPEYFYGYMETDYYKKTGATDMYLFGSLIVYYFTGNIMTALIGRNMDPTFRWNRFRGSFEDVKDYLIDGFYKGLKEFQKYFDDKNFAKDLSELIECCCYPIPEKRGFPSISSSKRNQYDFGKIATKIDILYRRANLKLK
jgi:serine/threonine protein kinase